MKYFGKDEENPRRSVWNPQGSGYLALQPDQGGEDEPDQPGDRFSGAQGGRGEHQDGANSDQLCAPGEEGVSPGY